MKVLKTLLYRYPEDYFIARCFYWELRQNGYHFELDTTFHRDSDMVVLLTNDSLSLLTPLVQEARSIVRTLVLILTEPLDLPAELADLPHLRIYVTQYQDGFDLLRERLRQSALTQEIPIVPSQTRSAAEYFEEGVMREEIGDNRGAINAFSSAIALNPAFGLAYYKRGMAHAQQGNLNDGLHDLSAALRLNPEHINIYYNRAFIFEVMGRINEALADYQNYIAKGGGAKYGDEMDVRAKIQQLKISLDQP